MENLFSNNMQRSRPSPHERWRTLYEQSISFQTFGIPVEPPYIDMDSIPAIAELDSEANNQAKQELLNFCHTLLCTRHQKVQTVKTENGGVTNFHTTEITYTSKQHYKLNLRQGLFYLFIFLTSSSKCFGVLILSATVSVTVGWLWRHRPHY